MSAFARYCAMAALAAIVSVCLCKATIAETGQELRMETTKVPLKGVENFTCLKAMSCIAKTPGHWWVGTQGGLVRLDEKTLTPERVYLPVDGLAGTRIWNLTVDGDAIWVGALGGVSRLDTKTDEIRTVRTDGYRWCFDFDKAGNRLWALSTTMVLCFDKNSDRPRVFALPSHTSDVVREGDALWSVTRKGDGKDQLRRLDTATGATKTRTGLDNPAAPLAGPDELFVGKDNLWARGPALGLRQGYFLYRIDKSTLDIELQDASTGLPHPCVQELTIAGDDVWASTTGDYNQHAHVGIAGQLCRYDSAGKRWEVVPSISSAKHDQPTCVRQLNGQLWVAARSYDTMKRMVVGWGKATVEDDAPDLKSLTVNRWDAGKKKWESFSIPRETDYDRINAMALEGKRLWFLVEQNGPWDKSSHDRKLYEGPQTRTIAGYVEIDRPRPQAVLFDKSPMPPPDLIQSRTGNPMDLLVDGGGVWVKRPGEHVPTDHGWVQIADQLWRLTDKRTCVKLEFATSLPSMFGVKLTETGPRSWFVPRATQDTAASMALDGDSLWIATMAHLCRYRISDGSLDKIDGTLVGFKPVGNISQMDSLTVAALGPIVAKAAGRVWFSPPWGLGTTVCGIYYLSDDRRTWKCALSDTHGRCFAESGNIVWIGTPKGLLRYDTKTDKSTLLTTRDGLVADDVIAVTVDADSLWVGTSSGISRLDRAVFNRP